MKYACTQISTTDYVLAMSYEMETQVWALLFKQVHIEAVYRT